MKMSRIEFLEGLETPFIRIIDRYKWALSKRYTKYSSALLRAAKILDLYAAKYKSLLAYVDLAGDSDPDKHQYLQDMKLIRDLVRQHITSVDYLVEKHAEYIGECIEIANQKERERHEKATRDFYARIHRKEKQEHEKKKKENRKKGIHTPDMWQNQPEVKPKGMGGSCIYKNLFDEEEVIEDLYTFGMDCDYLPSTRRHLFKETKQNY